MPNTSLGIYLDKVFFKYAKVQTEKNNVKVEAFNVVFYENLEKELERIILETGCSKVPISVNVSNEMYNSFSVLALMDPKDRVKSVKMDFETLCAENATNHEDYEANFDIYDSGTGNDNLTAIHIAVEKDEIAKTLRLFGKYKVKTLKPITTSIINLLDDPASENAVIVNLEADTKITTILNGNIAKIDVLNSGMKDILEVINETENSYRKAYEVIKNTTIYTGETQATSDDGNEYLEQILPVLSNILQETKNIIEDLPVGIDKIYLTGMGSAINNIELYFQEYAINSKCEVLKPYFLENSTLSSSLKDYIEVNSALALALDGIKDFSVLDEKKYNYKKGPNLNVDAKSLMSGDINLNMNMSGPLDAEEKVVLRFAGVCLFVIIAYLIISNSVINKIDEMKKEVDGKISAVSSEISRAEGDVSSIKAQAEHYAQISEVIRKVVEGSQDAIDSVPKIPRRAVSNLLKTISKIIPKDVMVVSVKNTEDMHVVIEVVSPDYEQIGYFKALLSTNKALKNIKSSSGQKVKGYVEDAEGIDEEWIFVTIEGDF